MNLAQPQTPTLTALLLGDPAPDRFERARQLRDFHRVADIDDIEVSRATRRAQIVDLLKAGPLSIRAIAERLKSDCGHVRNDVERLMANGITRRTGTGTGTHSNVLWHLAVDPAQAAAAVNKPKASGTRDLLAKVRDYMAPGVGYRPMDIYKALDTRPQTTHDALTMGLNEGVFTKTGGGRGNSGTVLYLLAVKKVERAA